MNDMRDILVEWFGKAVAQGQHAHFSLDCDYWGEQYADRVLEKLASDRIVVEPYCQACDGSGERYGDGYESDLGPCPDCDGSGFERMVPLAEILALLSKSFGTIQAAQLVERRFGGGER